jgi:hypothetical protein
MMVTVASDLDIKGVKKQVRSHGGKLDTAFDIGPGSFGMIHAGGTAAPLILKAATKAAAVDRARKICAATGIRPGPL